MGSTSMKKHVPTVTELLRYLEKGFHRTNAHELLSDIFECGAIAVSNKFDWPQSEKREQRYISIMKKYDTEMQKLIANVFAEIYVLLTSQLDVGFGDYLGELYMRSETSNSKAGQFFTPYCVSKLSAEVSIHATDIQRYIQCNIIMKSLPRLSLDMEKRIKLEAKKRVYEMNKQYEETFDAMILLAVRRVTGYGKKNLKRVYLAVRECYDELKEMYDAENGEILDIFKYRLKEECGIDIEKWHNDEFD